MPQAACPALVWFRDDLRLADNPALHRAAASGRPLVCLFVREDGHGGRRPLGGAAGWWLSRSLAALERAIAARGGRLILRAGDAGEIVPELVRETGAGLVVWNRRYDAAGIAVDKALKARLAAEGRTVESFSANLLREPWEVVSRAGAPLSVFTPYWRAHQALGAPRAPWPAPKALAALDGAPASDSLADWGLEPRAPNWAAGFAEAWTPGEAGARARLAAFLDEGLAAYAERRDRPDVAGSACLSPHLRFGEVSPAQVLHATSHRAAMDGRDPAKFLAELGWRDFAYHLLFHRPDLAQAPLQRRFDAFAWRRDPAALRAWTRGLTGYPLVDAGMRQLWRTGWMHNRVRMVAASFLVKHLLIDWREGERWFWDTLADADPASNPMNWQWVAGCGADAAPFFRIFNPVAQGERFDPAGDYVRRWVPELAGLPAGAIHAPWLAGRETLRAAGVRLGETYPRPVVDHAEARGRALAAFAATA